MMPETPATAPGNIPDLRRCTGKDMPGKIENTRDATYTANLEVLANVTVRIVSEEEKLNVEMQKNGRFLRNQVRCKPTGSCSKEDAPRKCQAKPGNRKSGKDARDDENTSEEGCRKITSQNEMH